MTNNDSKKAYAKKLILEYLDQLRQKTLQGNPLTKQEMQDTAQYNDLIDAIYRYNPEKIIEHGIDDKIPKACKKISRGTVYSAIKELEGDEEIEWIDGTLRLRETKSDYYKRYPILKFASEIQITKIPHQDIAFYRVGERFSAWVTEYINSRFNQGDIFAINLGSVIMCVDLKIPRSSNSVKKKKSLQKRVDEALKPFSLLDNRDFNDDDGYTAEDEQKRLDREAEKAEKEFEKQLYEFSTQSEPKYDGKITNLTRNIRKKPHET